MNIEKAREVVLYVVEQRRRWGSKLSAKDFSFDDLLEALVTIYDDSQSNMVAVNEAVVGANKEAGAAKARAKRAQNIVDELRAKNLELENRCKAWERHVANVEKQRDDIKAELEARK